MFQPRSICSNLGQFDFFFLLQQTKNIFSTFHPLFILLLLFISTLLISPTIPSLLSQHPSLYCFYLTAYLGSLEPQTFGFPLDSCPDALPLSHADLDASSTIFFNYIYIVVVINFLKLFKSDILIKENIPPIVGGAVASWLACSTPERALWVRALAGDIVLCSWARHFTLTVPLSTQVYKCVPANLMLGVTLRLTSIPSRGGE